MSTTDKPPLPPGWRYLEPWEIIQDGDLLKYNFRTWMFAKLEIGEAVFEDDWVIRRIEPDAEVERLKRLDCVMDEILLVVAEDGVYPGDHEIVSLISARIAELECEAAQAKAEVEWMRKEIHDSVDSEDAERKWLRSEVAILSESREWIPCSSRMPTAEDGDVNGQVFWTRSGSVAYWLEGWRVYSKDEAALMYWRKTGITELPQPPAEPEKPKRRRLFKERDSDRWYEVGWNVKVTNTPLAVEHLPGDPDLDVCRELISRLEKAELYGDGSVILPKQELREWVRKCKGVGDA